MGTEAGFAVEQGTGVVASWLWNAFSGGAHSAFELRTDYALAFYLEQDAFPDKLPQGVTTTRGDAICAVHDECGDYALYNLDVSIDGQEASLGTRERKQIGDYDVYHARTAEHSHWPSKACFDWFVSDTTLVITHHTVLGPTQDGN
ncbi:MAG: hypothetical protein QM778_04865 [Myxococcales bacterium]